MLSFSRREPPLGDFGRVAMERLPRLESRARRENFAGWRDSATYSD
jgi:hypothetical protein